MSLYWIYIRSARGPVIFDSPPSRAEATVATEMTPERSLHEFFTQMGSAYQAYTAESPEDLERAIADVNRLQNLPVRYRETIGRRDLSAMCLAVAVAGLSLLVAAKLLERSSW